MNAERTTPAFRNALKRLFDNNRVVGYTEAHDKSLATERTNQIPFFNPQADEISFFHFGIANAEFNQLPKSNSAGKIKSAINNFERIFLKNKSVNWSNYKQHKAQVGSYIDTILSIPQSPPYFGSGITLSNYVYPLIFDKLDSASAKEYVLIILSDFLTGSMFGNKNDDKRINEVYRDILNDNFTPPQIIKYTDERAADFYKVDFFEYAFWSRPIIGIIAYKIKPKAGKVSPEDISLFVNSDIRLHQRGYQSKDFKLSDVKVKFTHNSTLKPQRILLTIKALFGQREQELYSGEIATTRPGYWMLETEDSGGDAITYDSVNLSYNIPAIKIELDSAINSKDYDNLKFTYQFIASYVTDNANPVNFSYSTDRLVSKDSITFSSPIKIIMLQYGIPVVVVVLLVLFLLYYGKPKQIFISFTGYLDSFEVIDYKTMGKLVTPYKAWKDNDRVDYILIRGKVGYKSPGSFLNWKSSVYIKLLETTVPAGFDVFVKQASDDLKEFSKDHALMLKPGKNNEFSFVVGLRQNDALRHVSEPELVKFRAQAVIKDDRLFFTANFRKPIDYKFKIGPDLGSVWVGFDPGTSGSCVAVGTATEDIILGEDLKIPDPTNPGRRIIPSIVSISRKQDLNKDVTLLNHIYGNSADADRKMESQYLIFYSIKKLLGFKAKEVAVNGSHFSFEGKALAGLLVQGLFKDISPFFRSNNSSDAYKPSGIFMPQRAVVAIPNNYTIRKIQDMIDCIHTLKQFKEVRYVYEAEAVLFYYLSNYSRLNKTDDELNSENVLVFDMGGATINATIVDVERITENGRSKYDVDFLGKIGYGIGGDTIDYCLIKFLLSFKEEYPEFATINIHERKSALATLALKMKIEIIRNFYRGGHYLIDYSSLTYMINQELGTNINIDDENSEMYKYFKKVGGKFKLFEHPLFLNIIYNNVSDAVNEVVGLAENVHVDRIIFSGRSTAFPMIKETVEKQLKVKENQIKTLALEFEESKTAVALGACWYGVNKNAVRLHNLKTNAAFGFKRTASLDKTNAEFFELVEMGRPFDTHLDSISSFEGVKVINDDFANDGTKVNFYQVMGKDAKEIFAKNQKHKFSKIATVSIDKATSKIAMRVNENDEVECAVQLETNQKLIAPGLVADQEIDEANEEHYTWIVK